MFSHDRRALRQQYVLAWRKARQGQELEPVQRQIVGVIEQHPEYHALLEDEHCLEQDYRPEQGQSNPFLHMGMHLGLLEQISTNRPPGIVDIYQQLIRKHAGAHAAEHQMMECLGLALWQAQRDNRPPDEQAYLECLRKLL